MADVKVFAEVKSLEDFKHTLAESCGRMSERQINVLFGLSKEELTKSVAAAVTLLVDHRACKSSVEFVLEAMLPNWLGLQLPDRVRGIIALSAADDIVKHKFA